MKHTNMENKAEMCVVGTPTKQSWLGRHSLNSHVKREPQNHGDVPIRLKKENAERFMCQLLTVMDCGRSEVSINVKPRVMSD